MSAKLGPRASAAKSRVSTEDVYEALRWRILDHKIPPAAKINIVQLATELGVSQTPVREALRMLQGDNLVIAASNKGYATTEQLDAAGVRDLFEFRLLVEPWAAKAAAGNRLSNPAKELFEEIASFDTKTKAVKQEMIEHDSRFHSTILQATGNLALIGAYRQSHCHLHLFRMIRSDWDWKASLRQHRLIAEAIMDADGKAADEQMREHLRSAYRGFIGNLPGAPKSPIRETKGSGRVF